MGIQQNIRLEQSVDEYHPGWWHHFELHCPRKYAKPPGFMKFIIIFYYFISLYNITSYLSCDSPPAKWGPLNFIRRSLCVLCRARFARRISVGWMPEEMPQIDCQNRCQMSEQMPGWLIGCQNRFQVWCQNRMSANVLCQDHPTRWGSLEEK